MTKIERARLSDERAARLLILLRAGAHLVNHIEEHLVSSDTKPICMDSLPSSLCSRGEDEVFEDCVLDGSSAGKEFVSLRELDLGENGLRKSLEQRPRAEARCVLEIEWHSRAYVAAKKKSGGADVYSPLRYGVVFERELFLADVPEMRQWAKNEKRSSKLRGRSFYKTRFV